MEMKRKDLIVGVCIIITLATLFYFGSHPFLNKYNGSKDEATVFNKNEFMTTNYEYNYWFVRGAVFTNKIVELGTRLHSVGLGVIFHRLFAITGMVFLYLLLRKHKYSVFFSSMAVLNLFLISLGYFNNTLSLPIFMCFFFMGCYFDGIKRGYFWAIAVLTKFSSAFMFPFFINKVWKNKVWLGILAVAFLFINEFLSAFVLVSSTSRDFPHTGWEFFFWSVAWLSTAIFLVVFMIMMVMTLFMNKGENRWNSVLLLASLFLIHPLLAKTHLQYFIMWGCAALYTLLVLNDKVRFNVQRFRLFGTIVLIVCLIHRIFIMFFFKHPMF